MSKKVIFGVGVVAVLVVLFSWNFFRGSTNKFQNSGSGTGISQNSTSSSGSFQRTTDDLFGDNDSIVIYFSRTKGVYNGPLKVGNTKRVADYISEITGGKSYEIIPQNDYPDDYQKTTEIAREEKDQDVRPKIKSSLPDLSGYENVFIGGPVWWGEYPMIVRTFLDEKADELKDKNLIPFTTHEGSGLGNTQELLRRQFPNANVLDGFSVRGGEAENSRSDIENWLKEIEISK